MDRAREDAVQAVTALVDRLDRVPQLLDWSRDDTIARTLMDRLADAPSSWTMNRRASPRPMIPSCTRKGRLLPKMHSRLPTGWVCTHE